MQNQTVRASTVKANNSDKIEMHDFGLRPAALVLILKFVAVSNSCVCGDIESGG